MSGLVEEVLIGETQIQIRVKKNKRNTYLCLGIIISEKERVISEDPRDLNSKRKSEPKSLEDGQ